MFCQTGSRKEEYKVYFNLSKDKDGGVQENQTHSNTQWTLGIQKMQLLFS